MFGSKDSTEAAQPDDRQASLFPPDPAYARRDDSLQPRHYLIGGVLIAAMAGVLVTGYFYSRSLLIHEPGAETPAAPLPRAAAPAEPPAPPKKIATPAPAPAKEAKPASPAKPATPAEKAEKPAAPPAYFIQLAAFKDPRETARLCKRIEPLGFSCYFGSVDTPDGRYWRLRVGPYEAKDQAESDLAKLRGKGFDGRIIPLKKSGVKPPVRLPL